MTHYDTEVTWQPRPRDASWLRYYIVEGGADYYADGNGDLETRLQSGGAGFMLQSGAQVVARVENTFDRLVEPFSIRPGIVLGPGDYEYLRYSVSANSDPSLTLSGAVTASAGEFWDGTSQSLRGSFVVRPNYRLTLTGSARLQHGGPAGRSLRHHARGRPGLLWLQHQHVPELVRPIQRDDQAVQREHALQPDSSSAERSLRRLQRTARYGEPGADRSRLRS